MAVQAVTADLGGPGGSAVGIPATVRETASLRLPGPTPLSGGPLGDAPEDRRWIDDLGRARRFDAAKVALAGYLHQAALEYWDEGLPADSLRLDGWSAGLELCRTGRPVRERNCGHYGFAPSSCDVRMCPDCERARSARLVGRYGEIGATMAHSKLVTLTLPNVRPGELRPALGVLLDAFAHLRRQAIIAGGSCKRAHRQLAYDDVDQGEHHGSGDKVEPCSHPPHRRELAAAGSCRCARCLEVDVIRTGERVTANGCPRCHHEPVTGGVYGVEVTWSPRRPATHPKGYKETDDWHPHIHAVIDAPYIVQSELADAWCAVSCDAVRRAERKAAGLAGPLPRCEHPDGAEAKRLAGCRGGWVVDIRAIAGEPGSATQRDGIREALKYVSKGLLDRDNQLLPGAGPRELAELLLAIRGRRLVAGWGSFRNVHDDADDAAPDTIAVYTGEVDVHDHPIVLYMPKVCPFCGAEADWEADSARVPRVQCRRTAAGVLTWQPPNKPEPQPAPDPWAWARALGAWEYRDVFHE